MLLQHRVHLESERLVVVARGRGLRRGPLLLALVCGLGNGGSLRILKSAALVTGWGGTLVLVIGATVSNVGSDHIGRNRLVSDDRS